MNDTALLAMWDAQMRVVEVPYAEAVAREKNRYIEASSQSFPSAQRLTDLLFDEHVAFMFLISQRYARVAIKLALGVAVLPAAKSANVILRKDDWDTLWMYLVQLWVNQYGAVRARTTANTTRDDMQRIVSLALQPDVEFNPIQVAEDLLKARDLSKPRAEVIARTEVHAVMMFAGQEGAAKLSRDQGIVLEKRWVPVEDERSRANHAAMAGVAPIPLKSDFVVGGERMARPGDPRASAANIINCRCVCSYAVSE